MLCKYKSFIRYLSLPIILLTLQACSVVQATNGPDSKDLSVLNPGTDRFRVLAELGQPVVSEEDDSGNKVDVFSFVQGTNTAFRAGRAVGYGLLAVGTLGLSELITSPAEGALGDGAEIQVKVTYDTDDAVDEVEVLRDERWIPIQELGTEEESGETETG